MAWSALLPYKLVIAWQLAEYGKITEALSYCGAIEAELRLAVGGGGGPSGDGKAGGAGRQAAPPQLPPFLAATQVWSWGIV